MHTDRAPQTVPLGGNFGYLARFKEENLLLSRREGAALPGKAEAKLGVSLGNRHPTKLLVRQLAPVRLGVSP